MNAHRSFSDIFLVVLGLALAAPVTCFGQGQVLLSNLATDVDAPIFDVDGTTGLSGPNFVAQLYAGSTEQSLVPLAPTTTFRTGKSAGYLVSVTVSVPGVRPLATAFVQVRVWDTAAGATFDQAASVPGAKVGQSSVLKVVTGGAGFPPTPPATLSGLRSFALTMVKEPSFVVTSIEDSGAGSLRQAILDANSTPGVMETITFNIPPGIEPHLRPQSPLPDITDPVIIDGYSQPGARMNTLTSGNNALLQVQLDGAAAGEEANGLTILTGNCTVRGLAIKLFRGPAAILIEGSTAFNNSIEGNFIGTDASGGEKFPNEGAGIEISSGAHDNRIGGTSPGARNVISGNGSHGIIIQDSGSGGNVIQGNFIGTDVTGTNGLGNSDHAIYVSASGNTIGGTATGAGNVISGNEPSGVFLASGVTGNLVQGNFIGTDVTGTLELGNSHWGVYVQASKNTIGGTTMGAGNVISGNQEYGIFFESGAAGNFVQANFVGTDVTGTKALGNWIDGIYVQASNNTIGGMTTGARNVVSGNKNVGIFFESGANGNFVEGNFIGTDVTGTKALGNLAGGIYVQGSNNTVGGTTMAAGNVISGNKDAGIFFESGADGNFVEGNFIGTDVTGTKALGNSNSGIYIQASNNTIGGTTPRAGNVIAFNERGIVIPDGTRNRVSGNSIFGNIDLGIDLAEDGLTPNEPADADAGANNLQNFPEIRSVNLSGGNVTIQYAVPSTAVNSAYPLTVEFFLADGSGEGKTMLGSDTYDAPDATLPKMHSFSPTVIPAPGDKLVATATDANGNTSEFSPAVGPGLAPSIVQQPQNIEVVVGTEAKFNVIASGTPPLTYQWYRILDVPDSPVEEIPGATTDTLTLSQVQCTDRGTYAAKVSNPVAEVHSDGGFLGISGCVHLDSGVFQSDGSFQLTLSGEPGSQYIIQGSTDLIDWSVLATVANPTGTVKYTDQDAKSFLQRFYRAVQQ